jgi:3-methyladenine DNA glycosylase AlkD
LVAISGLRVRAAGRGFEDTKPDGVLRRRVAVVSTQHFVRHGRFAETLAVSELLLGDTEDLIHKATGWTLREVGKKDRAVLEGFLDRHATAMPRTMLRYAIERFPPERRRAYLQKKPNPSGGAVGGR